MANSLTFKTPLQQAAYDLLKPGKDVSIDALYALNDQRVVIFTTSRQKQQSIAAFIRRMNNHLAAAGDKRRITPGWSRRTYALRAIG